MNPRTGIPPCATAAARRLLVVALPLLWAVGCAGEAPDTAATDGRPAAAPGSARQVETRVGDATVTAVAIQTSQLPAEVATEHGFPRREDVVMLRLSARQGAPGNITTAPVEVRATATPLNGGTRGIELTEQVINGLVDHVGTIEVAVPDTLRFEIEVAAASGERDTLEFSRSFGEP